MAAYAALTSLQYAMDLLVGKKNNKRNKKRVEQFWDLPHPTPISLYEREVASLTENITFLQEFLEGYKSPVADSREADPLEMRIADAAYAAEDLIESHIVSMIELRRSTTAHKNIDPGEGTSSSARPKSQKKPMKFFNNFGFLMKPIMFAKEIELRASLSLGLLNVTREMDLIKKDVMKIKEEKGKGEADQVQGSILSASGGSSSSRSRSSIMVGFDDVLLEVLHKLGGGPPNLQVIPIVGMGGIGKTTLARHVYALPLVKERFDVFAWATISQNYNTKEILCELLSQANKKSKDELCNMSEDELGTQLYQYLFGRRFLIVLDDMWSIEAWDNIQRFFPNKSDGSRIVVTTRLLQLTCQLNNNYSLQMKFLDDASSWDLFSKTVGRKVVRLNCKKLVRRLWKIVEGFLYQLLWLGVF